MKTLLVIDMQNDFIDGALGTAEAVSIVEAVKEKINEGGSRGDQSAGAEEVARGLSPRREK